MMSTPESAYTKTGGLLSFARMLSKIRLHAEGRLREDFHANLGRFGDAWCCGFLHVEYEALRARVLEGGTNEEILEWCQGHGRALNETDILIWNHFITTLGRHDFATPSLRKLKAENGLADRDEIQTMIEFFEYDEGRKA